MVVLIAPQFKNTSYQNFSYFVMKLNSSHHDSLTVAEERDWTWFVATTEDFS